MNKKLLRSLISITSVVGIVTSIPFTVSTCSMSEEPIELKCNTNIESIYQDLGTIVNDTPALDKEIYTDTHIKVKSGVTFTCEGLKQQTGLNINTTSGVIYGTLTKKPTSPNFKIKFTANVDGKQLEGYTNPFTITVNPTKLECNDDTIPGDIIGDVNTMITATAPLSGHIETNTGESVSGVTFTCEGLNQQTGLDINETTGVINGTLTNKPTNPEFKIKFTANVHGKQLEGYTNAFMITVNPTELQCNDDTIPGDITGDINTSIAATASLSGHIKTNTGESVSGVTFTCEGLKQQTGLNINTTSGVIYGTLTKKPTSPNFKIKFTANVDGKQLEGYTNPFTITVNPTKLECNDNTIPGNITGNVNKQITTTTSLLNHIKTDTGESVSGVTFDCNGLPNGLSINQSTGAINGTPEEETSSKKFIITFNASIDGKQLEGQIDKFTTSIGPEIPSSLTSEVSVYDEIRSTTTNVATQELRGNIKTNTGVIVNKADHGLRFTLSQGSLPSGLSFNSDTGVISGTCTTVGTYKFKITANATVYGAALSYQTREFAITISNTILPDTVYKFQDTSRTILTGFTDEFIDNHSAYNSYNTMQIMGNVTSIAKDAFHGNSVTTIPPFIKNLTFAERSQCSSIGANAFQDAQSLTSVIFPNSLKEIGSSAFFRCRYIGSSITFPSSLESIDSYCFYQCWSVPSFDITNCEKLTTISNGAFQECSTITSIIIPDNVTFIDRYAFLSCNNLQSVDLSRCSQLATLGNIVFKNCTKLTSIHWNLPISYSTAITLGSEVFTNMPTGGTFKCSTAGVDLNALKSWLESKGFPTGWTFTR